MSVAAVDHEGGWPEHEGAWTLEDMLAMPESRHQRIELVDGGLVVTPAPGRPHQRASRRLANVLEAAAEAAGAPVEILETVNVTPAGGLVIPDIVVVPVEISKEDTPVLDAGSLLAVVEIVSPHSRRMDRLVKPSLYAEAGTPCYWRLELDGSPPHLVVCRLEKDRYVEVVTARGGEITEIPLPFPVTIDPADLIRI
jgi:Uma2 family endonuclease